ncbi:c-type cytochrome [Crenobacter caeni]|uniref:Cytochrome c n=1 Tax=Crenobacter caeni TaxID=2705474 RepID=A0A6B2KR96_9NEIS|nr:cytochrome c [Crenobacter caeni]NDV12581.1 cytochrome c [Crenobacter caeni]
MYKTLLLATLALAGTVHANPTAEARVKDFKAILRSFEPMGVVVRDRAPYRKDEFARLAASLKAAAPAPFARFAAGSQANSRAKAEIWSQPARFDAEKKQFIVAVDALNKAAQAGDLAAIRASYGQVGQSCKSCHDVFRGPPL